MDPQQWLALYDKRLDEVAARAKEAGECARQVGGTAISPRGEVTVRVGASGVLEDLTLTPETRTLESEELARLILDTTRKARQAVSAQVAAISAKYFGEGQLHGHNGSAGDAADRLSAIGGRLPSGLADAALGVFAQSLASDLRDAMTQAANTVTEVPSPAAEPSTRNVPREYCR